MSVASKSFVGPAAARQLVESHGAVLVDVRTPGEFASERLPGSRNVPLATLPAADLAHGGAPVILVCASGTRAGQARNLLDEGAGVPVHILEGGLTAWRKDGGAVESSGRGVWGMERQVRLAAGDLVIAFVVLSLAWDPLKWLAAAIGAGLAFAAVTDTCAMARVLALLPWNRRAA
ncbi:rhodanese-like domain-containing protein [Glycomyces algeriensis]|uniref:Sulfurtransferase n=1 Tax=Glycomyces algeriensis TaxID=256037 RepID=A0A9W6G8V7_9ACTN|nr:rhodanese-like domain-containing protein [Glycomyces algeriensis]MDA1364708.1 rhodanese-like domain-containing protein [Glycomyces algeriensis]MDR7350748.1 rhodanese-related sulfurtransferase [Glycomyces algeriensis]GLI43459.1 sulfurtransferase [Glycomyces algeriensis]